METCDNDELSTNISTVDFQKLKEILELFSSWVQSLSL
jgi:hypothetical protein